MEREGKLSELDETAVAVLRLACLDFVSKAEHHRFHLPADDPALEALREALSALE